MTHPDESLSNVMMLFRDSNGSPVIWDPTDCVSEGTPVDHSGEDMEYLGLIRATPQPIPPTPNERPTT